MRKKYKFFNLIEDEEEIEIRISGEIMSNNDKEINEYFGLTDGTSDNSFRNDLEKAEGKPITLYINSCGGDVFAASSIYNSLKEYKGNIVVKIDGLAASAASYIAMAGNKVLMSKTAQLMIHNPSTMAIGDQREMRHTADILDSIKESIINAYEEKTGLSREEISELMNNETWMSLDVAKKYGFVDGGIAEEEEENENIKNAIFNLQRMVYNKAKFRNVEEEENETETETEKEETQKEETQDKVENETEQEEKEQETETEEEKEKVDNEEEKPNEPTEEEIETLYEYEKER